MPRAQRERQMIAVAEEIFAERGYQAASMDDIAERVGVSKPMLYEYFGSKEGLLVACIRQARTELLGLTLASVEGVSTAEEALRRGLEAFFVYIDSHRRSWNLLRNEAAVAGQAAMDEIEAVRQQQTAVNTTLFASYLPHLPARDLEAYAEIIVGACERLAMWYVGREDVGPADAAELIMRMVWSGLSGAIATNGDK
ncbi:TetR family transcriptional regulator [Actinophytocola xanthii]|uniref:TetR family transcriptional regulator n=2 Tax=Actinophytocola xanthii TaxID=1912961 RepID=A0A1Q8CT23_9PSEU|nr:TetR/AcrR family transcriptional regulator [Actinophytocola xanthii]OLF17487.1 TetR family transcriptional regulator [Actinophytocola xanthii]